jgi:Archaeal Type IV pilin, N-terminal
MIQSGTENLILYRRHTSGTDYGVSEITGVIMLISIVVLGVAIIGVVLFSQSTPQEVPNVNFMTGTNSPPTELYLFHNGGDSLIAGSFSVVVDGVSRPYMVSGSDSEWSVGENLVIPITRAPAMVALVYNSSGVGPVIIHSAPVSASALTGPIGPDVLIPVTIVPGSCTGVSDPACASLIPPAIILDQFMKNVSGNSINFYKDAGCGLSVGSTISIGVSDPNATSSITMGKSSPTVIPLKNGDRITLTTRSSTKNFRTFGLSPQIWELTVENVDVNITYANGTHDTRNNADISHTWIARYSDFMSNLVLSGSGASSTALTVNMTQIINNDDSRAIMIRNVRPMPAGLFLIQVDDSANSAYFVGRADAILIDGAPLPAG